MFGFYTPFFLLQAFCVYHAYRNNAESRWYWFILLFPGIGSGFYLYHHFSNRTNIDAIAETVKVVVNNNYRIEQLEKAFRFSDNHNNRIHLADAYVEYGRYADAIALYEGALIGFMADDEGIRMKLLHAHFLNKNYHEAIALGTALEDKKIFKHAEQRILFAWALHYQNNTDAALKVFEDMDRSFTNYPHRLEYCKFLKATGKTDLLQEKVSELLQEFEHMRGPEKKLYRDIMSDVKSLIPSASNS